MVDGVEDLLEELIFVLVDFQFAYDFDAVRSVVGSVDDDLHHFERAISTVFEESHLLAAVIWRLDSNAWKGGILVAHIFDFSREGVVVIVYEASI